MEGLELWSIFIPPAPPIDIQITKIKMLLCQGYPLLVGGTTPKDWPSGLDEGSGHWIVVYGYDENGFSIIDPFCGRAFEVGGEMMKEFLVRNRISANWVIQSYPKVQ